MPFADTEKRREYSRIWQQNKRAKRNATVLNPNTTTKNTKNTTEGPDYLSYYDESTRPYVKLRVDALESQLHELKHPQAQHSINFAPEPGLSLSAEVTEQFRAKVNALERMAGPIGPRRTAADDLRQELERIRTQITQEDFQAFRTRIVAVKDILTGLEKRAQNLEKQIGMWEKGSKLRLEREAAINAERQRAEILLRSHDPTDHRKASALFMACDKKQGEIEIHLGGLKAELRPLRG